MSNITDMFKAHYGKSPLAVATAPGRLEILGNHTDYNEGITLSAAVSQTTIFAIAPVEGRICRMKDFRDGSEKQFNLDEIDAPAPKDWSNYIKGVIVELRKRNIQIGAFDGAILSDIPLSAGMSSSAALEVSAGFAFAEAFGIDLPKAEWAKIGQGVENNYMGLNSGLLDQFSSIFGQEDGLIYSDFRTNEVVRNVSLPHGYMIVVANSMVKHNLVDSAYNARRVSCENVVKKLQQVDPSIKALRDVSMDMLKANKALLDHQDYLKALHVVGECERVVAGAKMLENNDIEAFGKLLFESHESSKVNFDNSCPELDCLCELATSIPGCLGARLSGGGFGGISIHLVEASYADEYCERLKTAYKLQTGKETETIQCCIGAGAHVERI
ncbi:MAG: galactokinase [Victivallales bacterium]|nr:galactokinase [Victivallales bacterium]